MIRNLRLPALAALAAVLALWLPSGVAPENPCNTGDPCGTATAEPFTSSSTVEGEAFGLVTWQHCHLTRDPWTTRCAAPLTAPAYAGTLTGPPARCAKGVLYANGNVAAESLWVCQAP